MEEFGPLIAGAVVFRCLAAGIVWSGDSGTAADVGCAVNPGARHGFLAACERRMLTLFTCEPTGRRAYRVGLGLQARALARAILASDRPCRPVRWK